MAVGSIFDAGSAAGQARAVPAAARLSRFELRTVHLARFKKTITATASAIQIARTSAAEATGISVLSILLFTDVIGSEFAETSIRPLARRFPRIRRHIRPQGAVNRASWGSGACFDERLTELRPTRRSVRRDGIRRHHRLITAGRDQLGVKRQVFFVSTGGFDNHDNLVT